MNAKASSQRVVRARKVTNTNTNIDERIMFQMLHFNAANDGIVTKTKREVLLMIANALDVNVAYIKGTHVKATKRCSDDIPVIQSLSVMSAIVKEWLR